MKRVTIGLTLLAAIGIFQVGCGSACESADDRIIKRYEDCEITVSSPGSGSCASCPRAGGRWSGS